MDKRPTYAGKNKDAIAEQLIEFERKALEMIGDIKWLFSQQRGRRFAWRVLEQAIIDLDAFTKDAETYHILGRQAAAQKIRSIAQVECPEDFLLMIKENGRKATPEQSKEPKRVKEQ